MRKRKEVQELSWQNGVKSIKYLFCINSKKEEDVCTHPLLFCYISHSKLSQINHLDNIFVIIVEILSGHTPDESIVVSG